MVQVSGGALTRTSSVASSIKIKSKFSRKLRVDTIFEQGFAPCSFFSADLFARRSQAAMMASSNPIERSFEIAAERCEDLTPLVYRRLFDEHPEAQTMFRTEGSELVKGSMLALTIDAILDFAGERTGHFRLIACGGFLARRLWHAARIVHRVLRHHRRDAARTRRQRLVARNRCGVAQAARRHRRSRCSARELTTRPRLAD